jgi:hypothetical protein
MIETLCVAETKRSILGWVASRISQLDQPPLLSTKLYNSPNITKQEAPNDVKRVIDVVAMVSGTFSPKLGYTDSVLRYSERMGMSLPGVKYLSLSP